MTGRAADVRIRHVSVAVPYQAAYDFAHRPEHFSEWAAGLANSLHQEGDDWIADTPAGRAVVRFSPRNDFGVLDHWVVMTGKPEIYIPLRMIADGDGTLVELVLFRQPDMSDDEFDRDAGLVERDLAALKALLEAERG